MKGQVAVDASVIVAILNNERESAHFLGTLEKIQAIIGWPTVLEIRIWCVRRLGYPDEPWFRGWLNDSATLSVTFDGELERLAASAYERFGKGRHPAALNFGDAMSYAVAARYRAPLLFKGGDFGKTDLKIHSASVTAG